LEQRDAAKDLARERLGSNRYNKAVTEGANMTPEDAIAYVLNALDQFTNRADP